MLTISLSNRNLSACGHARRDRGRDDDSGRPSLRTGQANFWHPALQLVVTSKKIGKPQHAPVLRRTSQPRSSMPTCVPSRRPVPPMPIGHGSLHLVEPSRALPTVFVPLFCLSLFHLPASLCSPGISPFLRSYEGSVTFRARFFGPLVGHERHSFPE